MGKIPTAEKIEGKRSARRHSPYPKAPSTLGLSDDWEKFGVKSSNYRRGANGGFAQIGKKKQPARLDPLPAPRAPPPLANPPTHHSISARESRRGTPRLEPIAPRGTTAPQHIPPPPPPPLLAPPPPQATEGSAYAGAAATRASVSFEARPAAAATRRGSFSINETREERRTRKAAEAAAANKRRADEEAMIDARERAAMVGMLQEYDVAAALPPSPASELMQLAEDAAGDKHLCRELRAKIRTAVQATIAEVQTKEKAESEASSAPPPPNPFSRRPSAAASSADGALPYAPSAYALLASARGGSAVSNDAPPAADAAPLAYLLSSNRPAVLRAADLPALIGRLRADGEDGRADDAFIAERVFAGLDHEGIGEISAEVAVKGLFPAFSRDKTLRLRWLWENFYCPPHKGSALTATQLFGLLETIPEGCRLEEDLLAMINLAATKRAADEPVRITFEEYCHGLRGHRTEEADALGLRRRKRRGADLTRMMRARARSVMLAQMWGAGAAAGGGGAAAGAAALVEPPNGAATRGPHRRGA